MPDDYHAILGVPANASREEILRAYSALVKQVHPDQNRDDPDAKERFFRIQRAFEMLYTPERRQIKGAFHTPWSAFLRVRCLPNSVRRNVDSPGFLWPAMFVCLCLLMFAALMAFILMAF
jgi:curved DNA-binding protein CbpA